MESMGPQMESAIDLTIRIVTEYGISALGAVLMLVVGWTISSWSGRALKRVLGRSETVDPMLRGFFASLLRYAILAITVIAVLNQFGVQTASLIAVLGAAGLAIGLALQGTLSNLAAGVMILLFRPFRVGDYVEVAGLAGTVQGVNLFLTELVTPDNVQILAPNGQVWGSAVTNYSFHDTRRLDLVVGIDYGDDIEAAKATILDLLQADPRVMADPAPMVAVNGLGDSAVDMLARFWCGAGDYWPLKFDMTRAIKERLDRDGITIPYPQRVVRQIAADDA